MIRNICCRLRTGSACAARIRPETPSLPLFRNSGCWRGFANESSVSIESTAPFLRKRVDRRYEVSETREVPAHIVRPPVRSPSSLLRMNECMYFRRTKLIAQYNMICPD